jgi:hypothetical protein
VSGPGMLEFLETLRTPYTTTSDVKRSVTTLVELPAPSTPLKVASQTAIAPVPTPKSKPAKKTIPVVKPAHKQVCTTKGCTKWGVRKYKGRWKCTACLAEFRARRKEQERELRKACRPSNHPKS